MAEPGCCKEKMRKIIISLLILQLAVTAEVSLKSVLRSGDKFKYTVETEQTVNQIVQGHR